MPHPIDLATWPRKEIFDFYNSADPLYSVSFRIDVSGVYRYTKPRGLSFYLGLCWAVTEAMNRVENFRYVIREGQVWLLDERRPSFTDIRPDTHLFYMVTLPMDQDIDAFCRRAKEQSQQQGFFVDLSTEGDDLVLLSCLPTVDMTGITTSRSTRPDDSMPRVTWGRYTIDAEGRRTLGMALEVNHRLIDGYHVGCFVTELEAVIRDLGERGAP